MLLVLVNFILEVYFYYNNIDPDLVERFKDNLKLSESNPKQWFGGNHEGYSDYPTY